MMVGQTFADAFWGISLSSTAGFEALVKRNHEGKKITQELEEYMKKRSKLEAEYSKTLANLNKCFKIRDETGSLEETLNMFKNEIETMANSHQGASVFFANQAENVKKFRDEQSVKKKQKEEAVQKTQSAKLSHLSKTLQLEKTYFKKCNERDNAVAIARDVDSENPPPPQKELEKVRNKAIKAEEEVQKADNLYRSAVIVLEDVRANWEREMHSFCMVSQEMDEARIRFLRQEIWTCLNVDSKLSLDVDNSCENVRLKLENCSIANDILSFIQTACTGSSRPEQYRYKPYGQTQLSTGENSAESAYVDVDLIFKAREAKEAQRKK